MKKTITTTMSVSPLLRRLSILLFVMTLLTMIASAQTTVTNRNKVNGKVSELSPEMKDLLNYYDKQIYFTENKGQIVDQNNNPNPLVKYLFSGNGLNLQLRQSGFSYDVWRKERNGKSNKKEILNSLHEEKVKYKPLCNESAHFF